MSTPAIDPQLLAALKKISIAPQLLIASDFDGTLSPLTTVPANATISEVTVALLTKLANLANTQVALISGRGREDLKQVSRLAGEPIIFVGSHGAEMVADSSTSLTPQLTSKLEEIIQYLEDNAANLPGAFVEVKPTAAVFHYRNSDPTQALPIIKKIKYHFQADKDIFFTAGKMVLEYSVLEASKGNALTVLKTTVKATHTLFIGDDVTDETGFEVLNNSSDLSIKVGPPPTKAKYWVKDLTYVPHLLQIILTDRQAALSQ